MKVKGVILFSLIVVFILTSMNTQMLSQIFVEDRVVFRESIALCGMFQRIESAIVYCYSGQSKTTGILVSDDGWVLTAGHKVDRDFPEANPIFMKIDRTAIEEKDKFFKSTQIISPETGYDLMLFKTDYKPKYYFKKFVLPTRNEEAWVFGFRGSGNKSPIGPGFINTNLLRPDLLLITTFVAPGNSGSPVVNRSGDVVGIVVAMVMDSGDGLLIPGNVVNDFLKRNFDKIQEEQKKKNK